MRLLITSLGRSPYALTTYQLPNGFRHITKLVSDALYRYLNPDKVYVVGTEESLWDLASELLGEYEKVVVPYGKSPEEFWEMFRVLSELDVDGKEVYLDITHGFRSIPLFVSTLVNLFTKIKSAQVKGIYYGIWEARHKEGDEEITPVVDLLPLVQLNEWIEGFTLFAHYADGQRLTELIESQIQKVPSQSRKKLGKINSIPKVLTKYSQAVGFNAPSEIINSFHKLKSMFSQVKDPDLPTGMEPVSILREAFLKEARRFDGLEKEWEKQLHVAKWLFDKRRYAQSVIVLEESLFTYVLETLGFDPLDEVRKRLGGLFKKDCQRYELFTEEFNNLFSKVQDLRNKSGHAFMKKNISDRDFTESIRKLKEYLETSFSLLHSEKCIKDAEKVKLLITYLWDDFNWGEKTPLTE